MKKSDNVIKPLLDMVGVKTYSEFERSAAYCLIKLDNELDKIATISFNTAEKKRSLFYGSGAEGLTKTDARVFEQLQINQYGLSKNGGQLLNKINSIDPKFWYLYNIKLP